LHFNQLKYRSAQRPLASESSVKKNVIFSWLGCLIKLFKVVFCRFIQATRQVQVTISQAFDTWLFKLSQHRPWVLSGLKLIAPHHLGISQMNAVMTSRKFGWHKAAPLYLKVEKWRSNHSIVKPQYLLPSSKLVQSLPLCIPHNDRQLNLSPDLAAQIVVYTVCFGRRPYLLPLIGQPEGLRFLCFTDVAVAVEVPGWEVIVVPQKPKDNAFATICPHHLLKEAAPNAEWSLFLEYGQIPVGNLQTLITRWLIQNDMVLWRHSSANDWHGIAESLLLSGEHPAAPVLQQTVAFEAQNVPCDRGASDTAMIWRRHANAAIQAHMEAWWEVHKAEPEGDTSMSFYRLAQEQHLPAGRIAQLPCVLGTAKKNIFFAANTPGLETLRPRLPLPELATRKIPITFLYSEKRRDSGITLMRARQLSEMVAETYPDCYDVTLTSDIGSVRDQAVIVNRGAIEFNTLDRLAELRARNIVSISDWLDAPVRAEANIAFDAHMTLCLPQAIELNRLYPTIPAFHVTHHVNPNVPECVSMTDKLRTGYFGRLANTSRPNSLLRNIDLINVVDASFTKQDWMQYAPLYNCHWIVREMDHLQEWKPFLKAFVAARCGAVVIVTRDDMNAMHYLGDDYPFYADSLAPEDLEMAWLKVASAFGGKDWHKAQAIMRQVKARSSDRQIMVEFKAMLNEILT
jgi:hypothetical protein